MSTLLLLTIIADDSLKNVIEEEISVLGAKGYTTSSVEGKGRSGLRNDVWSGENVKIETVIDRKVLSAIMQRLQSSFFDKYAIIAYFQDVEVVRTSHFK